MYPRKVESYTDLLDMVANRSCEFALVDDMTAHLGVHGEHCGKLVTTGKSIPVSGGASFIIPTGSPYAEAVGRATLKLKSDGMLQTLDDFFEKQGKCEAVFEKALTLKSLVIFFVAIYSICIVICLKMVFDPQPETVKETALETQVAAAAIETETVENTDCDDM